MAILGWALFLLMFWCYLGLYAYLTHFDDLQESFLQDRNDSAWHHARSAIAYLRRLLWWPVILLTSGDDDDDDSCNQNG